MRRVQSRMVSLKRPLTIYLAIFGACIVLDGLLLSLVSEMKSWPIHGRLDPSASFGAVIRHLLEGLMVVVVWIVALIAHLFSGVIGWVLSLFGLPYEDLAETPSLLLLIGGALIGISLFIEYKMNLAERSLKQRKDQERAEENAQKAIEEEESRLSRLKNAQISRGKEIEQEVKSLFQAANYYAQYALKHLRHAENEYKEEAYRPFWVAVKNVTQNLSMYHRCISSLNHLSGEYNDMRKSGVTELKGMTVLSKKFPSVRKISIELKSIVRKAEKHKHFSSIGSTFRVEQSLHSMSSTIESAIYGVGESISSSMETLAISLDTQIEELIDVNKDIIHHVDQSRSESSTLMKDLSNHELSGMMLELKEMNVMVDNIQRKRDPDRLW